MYMYTYTCVCLCVKKRGMGEMISIVERLLLGLDWSEGKEIDVGGKFGGRKHEDTIGNKLDRTLNSKK